ncbi:hypothetical protein SADUNF_Sadunf16G0161800 [Salix dunnii]|uniref:Biotin carboxylation domain-containing protein n=1 Tax=Salix dunnii TaxID=1413687 RepID=A0A835JCF5_9ROSI|nr:hypothetical protein SADUNF_Sadunf16G0161800 [Salix dunnii]
MPGFIHASENPEFSDAMDVKGIALLAPQPLNSSTLGYDWLILPGSSSRCSYPTLERASLESRYISPLTLIDMECSSIAVIVVFLLHERFQGTTV